jgi:hypothetical protein
MARRPVATTTKELAELRRLAADGLWKAECGRIIGRAKRWVSDWGRKEGLVFDKAPGWVNSRPKIKPDIVVVDVPCPVPAARNRVYIMMSGYREGAGK